MKSLCRYSHFLSLYQEMKEDMLVVFPAKYWYGNKSKRVVSERMDLINSFFQSLSQDQFSHPLLRAFFAFPETGMPKVNFV